MLARLQQMMQNMRSMQMVRMRGGQNRAGGPLRQLQELIRRQQELQNRTFRSGQPGQQMPGAADQQALRDMLQQLRGMSQSMLIDDTYNANPDSTLAAIAVLAGMEGKRVLVLGDMGELGELVADEHRRVGEAAKSAGLDGLCTLGELSEHATRAFGDGACHFASIEDLLAAVQAQLGPKTTVLVKGSRFMRMERVVQSLKAKQT